MVRKELQLLIAVSGIYFCYFKVGLIQEKLFKSNFGSKDFPSPKFEYSSILILFQMLIYNLLCVIMVYRNKIKFVCTRKEGAGLGLLNFLSMIGALTALQFVSFPLQALVKSCKQIFIKFTKQQILCGLIITVGIYVFNVSESSGSNKTSSIFGIILLMVSLFSDGCLATLQSKLKSKNLDQWEMGFHISLWSFIGSIFYQMIQGKTIQFLSYVEQYTSIVPEIIYLTIYSVLGQVFIFYCISCFSPRVLSVVTTTRKFFTVLLSIIIHNHQVNHTQWVGISLVASGVAWELYMGMNSRSHGDKKKDSQIKPNQDIKEIEKTNKNGNHKKNHRNKSNK